VVLAEDLQWCNAGKNQTEWIAGVLVAIMPAEHWKLHLAASLTFAMQLQWMAAPLHHINIANKEKSARIVLAVGH